MDNICCFWFRLLTEKWISLRDKIWSHLLAKSSNFTLNFTFESRISPLIVWVLYWSSSSWSSWSLSFPLGHNLIVSYVISSLAQSTIFNNIIVWFVHAIWKLNKSLLSSSGECCDSDYLVDLCFVSFFFYLVLVCTAHSFSLEYASCEIQKSFR